MRMQELLYGETQANHDRPATASHRRKWRDALPSREGRGCAVRRVVPLRALQDGLEVGNFRKVGRIFKPQTHQWGIELWDDRESCRAACGCAETPTIRASGTMAT